MRRSTPPPVRVPFLPISLVVVGSLSVVTGVAVPIRLLSVGPATVVTGGISLIHLPVAIGVALVVAVTLGTLLISFDGGIL